MYSMISVNTAGIRENNRRDLVINYCKTLDMDYSIWQEIHVNFSHLLDVREIWDGEVTISPVETQTCGVLVLAKRAGSFIAQIISDPVGRYVFFKIKNTTHAVLNLYVPSGIIEKCRIADNCL